jgi:hypothetical protein
MDNSCNDLLIFKKSAKEISNQMFLDVFIFSVYDQLQLLKN